MKRILLLVMLMTAMGVASCQCANKPDIGPVEDEARLETARVSQSA